MAIPDVASSIPTSNNERFVCMRTQLGPRASVPKMLARIQADQGIACTLGESLRNILRFHIRRERTHIFRRRGFFDLRFKMDCLLHQESSKEGIRSLVGKLEQRPNLTQQIRTIQHSDEPHRPHWIDYAGLGHWFPFEA